MLDKVEIENMNAYFKEVASSHGITVEEVIQSFENALELVSKVPSCAGKSRKFIMDRAKSAMDAYFANKPKSGEPFNWLFWNKLGRTTDWNGSQIDTNEEDIKKGKIELLIKEERIMTMEVDGKRVPLSVVSKYEEKDAWIHNGKVVFEDPQDDKATKFKHQTPVEGKPWVAGEPFVLRDHRVFIENEKKGNRPNIMYSHELKHSYEITIVGMAYPVGKANDARLFEKTIGYDQANAASDKFFFKKFKPFHMYVSNFEIDEQKSKPWKYVFAGKTAVEGKTSSEDISDIDIKIEEFLEELNKQFGDEAIKAKDFIPQVYYLNQIKDAHERCLDKKDGLVQKSQSGYDKTKWNAYILLKSQVQLLESKNKVGTFYYVLNDSTVKNGVTAFYDKETVLEMPAKLPGPCIMAVKTKRDTNRYDKVSNKKVYDPENADVQITIEGIASTGEVPKMVEVVEIGYGDK